MTNEISPWLLSVEAAWCGEKFIGYHLKACATHTLIYADQASMPGLRSGEYFVASVGETIEYRPISLTVQASGKAQQASDTDLRKMWRDAGGNFYGPNVETGSMPEAQLLPFLRALAAQPAPVAAQQAVGSDVLGVSGRSTWPKMHPATESLVRRFSWALANKLADAEKKYGYSDGWASPDWLDECRQHLMEHITKGDPRDVAAYCAFLWHHGASTAAAPTVQATGELERTAAVVAAAHQWLCERTIHDWDEADLAKALIRLAGDWAGCPECDHNCDEPCMPATEEAQLRMVDCQVAQLIHEGKLIAHEGYKPPDGWQPMNWPRKRATPQPKPSEIAKLGKVRAAVDAYHLALDNREHGGVAAGNALDAIQEALGMPWVQGAASETKGATP